MNVPQMHFEERPVRIARQLCIGGIGFAVYAYLFAFIWAVTP